MSPKKISILLVGNWAEITDDFFVRVQKDPLMDVVDIVADSCPLPERLTSFLPENQDVILIKLPKDVTRCETLITELKQWTRTKLIGISPDHKTAETCRPLLHACIVQNTDSQFVSFDDQYEHLRYLIKNARIAAMAEKAGLQGKWAALPYVQTAETPICVGSKFDLIAIGASAGGTEAIAAVLSRLPSNMPPILVVQHMPRDFVSLFAQHLRDKCHMQVCLAVGDERLVSGTVYLTAEDKHLTVVKRNNEYFISCQNCEKMSGHRPSVDKLFFSVAAAAGDKAIGVILTGMGADGAKGLLEMRKQGAYTIGQNKDSCAVYGMPQVAFSLGAVMKQLPLMRISGDLKAAVSDKERR